MMAKFKVGDRVMMKFNTGRITRKAWNEFGYKSAEPAVVAAVDNGDIYFKYRVLLDNKNPTDCGYWWAAESELSPLAPAVPDGWTSADEPPIDDHDVRVLTKNGDGMGWYGKSIFPEETGWRIYPSASAFNWKRAAPGEVLAWREIEPAAKADPRVRYCVAADLPTSITVWHDTFESADAEAQRLCVKCGKPFRVLKVVEEVKPGSPVITKLEE